MCGILGFISKNNENNMNNENIDDSIDIVTNCLKGLQNRGYDSIGISTIQNSAFVIKKKIGFNTLDSDFLGKNQFTNCIGHTRWATHGAVCEKNAHPHLDSICKLFTIVHNGIIENYLYLKSILQMNNVTLYSDTDTEILLNYIVLKYIKNEQNIDDETKIKVSILEALKNVEGTYGIIIQSLHHPDKLFCIRKGSPILIGVNQNHTKLIILSEKQAFPDCIDKIIRIQSNELIVCKFNNEILIKEFVMSEPITKIENQQDSLGDYKFFTEKEIFDQINLVKNVTKMYSRIVQNYGVKLGGLDTLRDELKKVKYLFLFGCGTSYHACLILQYLFLKFSAFEQIFVFDASDFDTIYLPPYIDTNSITGIFVSQSGETMDLLMCHSQFINFYKDVITLGITNVVDSNLSSITNAGIYINAGREKGVASTKSFTSQILGGVLILLWFNQLHNYDIDHNKFLIHELKKFDHQLEFLIQKINLDVQSIIIPFIKPYKKMFIMGRNIDFFVAKEGSLKLKEIAYINIEAYTSGALKHGPFALLDSEHFVIFIMTNQFYKNKIKNNILEIISRKTPILLITNHNIEIKSPLLLVYHINDGFYNFLVASIVLQLISLHLSIEHGINPDFPRNLAKVVTVE